MVPAIDKGKYPGNEVGEMLPEMTAIFFDGLTANSTGLSSPESPNISLRSNLDSRIQFLRLPPTNRARRARSTWLEDGPVVKEAALAVYRSEDQFTMLRTLVLNLSHAYNNTLMGILGYVTLIDMDLKYAPDENKTIPQMEQLIQTGANLINLIFGYLVERRLPAKRLHLLQLFGEFELGVHPEYRGIDIDDFKNNMKQIDALNNQSKIIAALARVMEQLLFWVKDESASLERLKPGCSRTNSRLRAIDALIDRGFKIVQDIMYYARDIKPTFSRMSLRVLIQKHIRQLQRNSSRITIWDDLPKRWPWIFADSRQIDYALQQVIDNAVQAMPGEGSLSIRVRTLTDEWPSERCAVRSDRDYIVITIADNGKGMDIDTQARIFQPFFKKKTNCSFHAGLGLSAASGIVKAHGGYVQVRSAPGIGTRIKVYLPIKQAA